MRPERMSSGPSVLRASSAQPVEANSSEPTRVRQCRAQPSRPSRRQQVQHSRSRSSGFAAANATRTASLGAIRRVGRTAHGSPQAAAAAPSRSIATATGSTGCTTGSSATATRSTTSIAGRAIGASDNRYDWHSYRSRYGSLYRLGRYYDPYGWGYRRFSIGYSLWPSYYGSNYWLNDPWQYRLPPAYGPYRWVRYYDDALLVNIYTGQVVDVIHNFFW